MKLKNQELFEEAWGNNNSNGYSSSGMMFAVMWAGAMERELAAGKKLEEIADEFSTEADKALGQYGMTGFLYGVAVGFLSEVWEHGEELKLWHNKQYGVENGIGVVNPALMTVAIEQVD
jgi:hypothetical protein